MKLSWTKYKARNYINIMAKEEELKNKNTAKRQAIRVKKDRSR